MANYSYTESLFEEAVLELFEKQDYVYECGYDIHRTNEDIFILEDFKTYLSNRYSKLDLQEDEIEQIVHNLEFAKSPNIYVSMRNTLKVLREGFILNREKYNKKTEHIEYFDYKNTNNIFKVINQYEIKDIKTRRPDIVIFINGIPVSVIELKNLSKEKVQLYDAYLQLTNRYTRDIPNIMRYSFLSVISDGANTKVGSLFGKYEHFYSWKSVDGKKYFDDGIDSLYSLIQGLFEHRTLLNILQNYIYFPDNTNKNLMILPKYSQYYASEMLLQNIKNHIKPKGDGKGGIYFGATGCGKSYTMLFLSRKLVTDKELANPTIILLTDRTDLDDQLSEIFEESKQYLIDDNVLKIQDRKMLTEKLEGISSGGVFLMTVQKFDDNIDLLSDRTNIICISDEAHRTQVSLDLKLEVTTEGVKKHYGFAKYLRDCFPNATYVGFTGTPIDSSIKVFGDIVLSYKMSQAVADGATVGINLLPGPSKVQLDKDKIKIVDKFYDDLIKSGANKAQVEQSKKEMATVRTIIDNDSRLDIVIDHFIKHYKLRVQEGSTVKGKAMFVCYDRKIAYKVYNKIIDKCPEWNEQKRTQEDETKFSEQELEKLKLIEMIKLVATRSQDDDKQLYDLLGTKEYRVELAKLFKNENSNFKIAIVVDMWMTGFDCECLDTMYIDKPLEKHSLIQTISRVNRVFKNKDNGLIIDYIGIKNSLEKAMAIYDGDVNPTTEIENAYKIFKEQLKLVDDLMIEFDSSMFKTGTPLQKLECLKQGVEFISEFENKKNKFIGLVARMKKAFDICVGDEKITEEEMYRVHFYFAIKSLLNKITGEGQYDTVLMNKKVKQLVDDCIKALENQPEGEKTEVEIFSDEYLERIKKIQYVNIKYIELMKLLKKTINEYKKINTTKAIDFSKRMQAVIDKYNERDSKIEENALPREYVENLSKEIDDILKDIAKDATEFKQLGISIEEKSYYDILKTIKQKYNFNNNKEITINIAKEINSKIKEQSKYTDFLNKVSTKSDLQANIIRIIYNSNFLPDNIKKNYSQISKDIYEEVIKQLENSQKYLN
ncbi:MAG: type I restriction endonuclease subunit R [Elusimicrobia bacterium]|nr:type I restriction endonuclease subunit R [Elusimicrobiota bacterium]